MELKKRFVSTSMLVISQIEKSFEVYYDASHKGLNCVLMQEKRTVAYALRQLKVHKRNYPIYNLELVVVVFTLKI